MPAVRDWHFDWLDVPALLEAADMVLEYPMVDQDPLERWSFGRLTLLATPAHPMVPRGANGAAQAILDCRALADCLQSNPDPLAALGEYERLRLPATGEGGADQPAESRRMRSCAKCSCAPATGRSARSTTSSAARSSPACPSAITGSPAPTRKACSAADERAAARGVDQRRAAQDLRDGAMIAVEFGDYRIALYACRLASFSPPTARARTPRRC
jgi:hypothetical protein